MTVNLRIELAEWRDVDIALFLLGQSVGAFRSDLTLPDVKWVVWSDNPVGRALLSILETLATTGVLEYDKDEQRVRWKGECAGIDGVVAIQTK